MIALHKSGLDVFSALCYFFAMILPALQGSAGDICGALLDGKNDTVLRFAVIAEQQLFYSKVIGAVKADDAPPAAPARPHPYQIFSRNLGQNTMRRW